jgi:hypothetical protein
MGCAGSVNVEAVKAQFEVTSPSSRGKVLLSSGSPGSAEIDDAMGSTRCLVQNATAKVVDNPGELIDVVEETTKSLLFRTKCSAPNLDGELTFFDAAGNVVALLSERQLVNRGNARWLLWSARPWAEGQKSYSKKSHGDVALYPWGMFRWTEGRKGNIIDFVEVKGDDDPVLKQTMSPLDGTAALVMEHNWHNRSIVIYGPGAEAATKKNDTWLRGKPVAVITAVHPPYKVDMATQADEILLFAMTHCNQYLNHCDFVQNCAGVQNAIM